MSTEMADSPLNPPADPPAAGGPAGPGSVPRGGAWRLSPHGVRTVAVLELRQRVRSTRWVIVLVVWGLIIGGLTTLIRFAVHASLDPRAGSGATISTGGQVIDSTTVSDAAGQTMFGIIVFLVLGLAGLVAPALTATSVNGDRSAGVLATLQTTLLSSAEIAIGKLLAAWTTALALLAVASPFIGWAYLEGGTPAGRLLVILLLLAFMLLVVCAIALGWSAVAARTSTSAVLTYLSVAFLGLGLPMLFALSIPLVTQTERVKVIQPQPTSTDPTTGAPTQGSTFSCVQTTQEMPRLHTERVWWLLAANPFVVLADAAPRPADSHVSSSDPLTGIRGAVREARLGPPELEDWCSNGTFVYGDGAAQTMPTAESAAEAQAKRDKDREALGVVWPFGLAADLALGAGFVVLTVRRLRAPARTLPRGTRVA
jgi:ABC-type transport system involved in multi-copper enzyme maturation permease subunit